MKKIKSFTQFFEAITTMVNKPKYKKPEYEFKEFYRVFKSNPELREILPQNIDQEIFSIKGDGFQGEPSWIDLHVDPPSREGEITTPELIEIAEEEDPRFIPFITYCQRLFERGKMETLTLDFIIPNLDDKFKGHDWHVVKENPEYLNDCEIEYKKALAAGIEDLNQLGLVKKYPGVNISDAQFWDLYAKGSINYFNSAVSKGKEIPCTQFILHNGVYYTVGGRRRMFWHFYNKINPTVWVILADL
jgi:hypothetical protein